MMNTIRIAYTSFISEKGVILPWVLIFCYIIIFLTITGVEHYKYQLLLTQSHKEAIKIQHVLEVSRKALELELSALPPQNSNHAFLMSNANGESEASCFRESETQWVCEWEITGEKGGTKFIKTFHNQKIAPH